MGTNRRQTKGCDSVDDTRQRLIDAGLSIFSHHNYEGATTRLIAEKAGVNLAAILYHFGGKEGLYKATISSVLERFKVQVSPLVDHLRHTIENTQPDRPQIVTHLCDFLCDFISGIISLNIPRSWLRLGFSDENAPVHAFDLIYEGIICPIHKLVGEIVAKVQNLSPDDPETILRTHAIMGQVIAFHLSREAVLRRLQTDELTTDHVRLIRTIIQDHVQAILLRPSATALGLEISP